MPRERRLPAKREVVQRAGKMQSWARVARKRVEERREQQFVPGIGRSFA
jgi:hypothetical protein